MKRFLMTGIIAFAAMVAMPTAALAAPIEGGISFAGDAEPNAGATDWADATGIDFGPQPNARVISVSGSYAAEGVPAGAIAGQLTNFYDFTFNPFAGPHLLWDFTHNLKVFDFTLESVNIDDQGYTPQGNSFLHLSGLGTLRITGYDDTPGSWIFTGNEAAGTFSFSASNAAIPEPTLLALFGLGLAAAGTSAARRRRKA